MSLAAIDAADGWRSPGDERLAPAVALGLDMPTNSTDARPISSAKSAE
jgi:hypothetical protein